MWNGYKDVMRLLWAFGSEKSVYCERFWTLLPVKLSLFTRLLSWPSECKLSFLHEIFNLERIFLIIITRTTVYYIIRSISAIFGVSGLSHRSAIEREKIASILWMNQLIPASLTFNLYSCTRLRLRQAKLKLVFLPFLGVLIAWYVSVLHKEVFWKEV